MTLLDSPRRTRGTLPAGHGALTSACVLAEAFSHYSQSQGTRTRFRWHLNDLFLLICADPLAYWARQNPSTTALRRLGSPVWMSQSLTGVPVPPAGLPDFTTARRVDEIAVALRVVIGPEAMDDLPPLVLRSLAETFTGSPRWGVTGDLRTPERRAGEMAHLLPITRELTEMTSSLAARLHLRQPDLSHDHLLDTTEALCEPVAHTWRRLTDTRPILDDLHTGMYS